MTRTSHSPSVAEVAEEHLVLVGVVVADGADLAVGALPLVVGHVLQQLQLEAGAGRVAGGRALGAVQ